MRNVITIIAIISLLFCGGRSWAHAIWIDGADKTYRIVYGEPGVNEERYDPAKVVMARALDENGKSVTCGRKDTARGVELTLASDAAAMIVRLDNGYWVKKNGKWLSLIHI